MRGWLHIARCRKNWIFKFSSANFWSEYAVLLSSRKVLVMQTKSLWQQLCVYVELRMMFNMSSARRLHSETSMVCETVRLSYRSSRCRSVLPAARTQLVQCLQCAESCEEAIAVRRQRGGFNGDQVQRILVHHSWCTKAVRREDFTQRLYSAAVAVCHPRACPGLGSTTERPKAESGGRVFGRGQKPPPHQLGGMGSAVSSPRPPKGFHYFHHSGWPLLTL